MNTESIITSTVHCAYLLLSLISHNFIYFFIFSVTHVGQGLPTQEHEVQKQPQQEKRDRRFSCECSYVWRASIRIIAQYRAALVSDDEVKPCANGDWSIFRQTRGDWEVASKHD